MDIYFVQALTTTQIGNQNLAGASFTWQGNIPSSALVGSATIRVCPGSICKNATINVAL